MVAKLSEINKNNNSTVNMEHIEKLIESKFETVNVKLDGITGRLDTINGSVGKHDKQINEALIWRSKKYTEIDDKHELYDECMVDVRKLMNESIGSKAMKKYNARLFIISTTVLALIITGMGIWMKSGGGI